MSALGQKQRSAPQKIMSAWPHSSARRRNEKTPGTPFDGARAHSSTSIALASSVSGLPLAALAVMSDAALLMQGRSNSTRSLGEGLQCAYKHRSKLEIVGAYEEIRAAHLVALYGLPE